MTTTEQPVQVTTDESHTVSGIVGRGGSRPKGNLVTVRYANTFISSDQIRYLCERCGKDWPSFQSLWSHVQWHDHPKREGIGGGKPKGLTLDEHFEAIRTLVQPAPDASLWKSRALKAERQLATLRKLLGGSE
jgi:hypothetical protein